MKIGIVGLPFSGKTTVFNALTGAGAPAGVPSSPLSDRHLAVVLLPDERVGFLASLYRPKATTFVSIELSDFPGVPTSDVRGRRELLDAFREMDLLLLVVRGFESVEPPRIEDEASALRSELLLADLGFVETRLDRIEASLRRGTGDAARLGRESAVLRRCRETLESQTSLTTLHLAPEDWAAVSSFSFLSRKPWLWLLDLGETSELPSPSLREALGGPVEVIRGQLEAELAEIPEDERASFLEDYGMEGLSRDRLLRACFETAGRISFFTVGEKEVRAWPLPRGATVLQAADRVHSDMARGFIRAEVVSFDDLQRAGDMKAARAAGRLRLEGREYVVEDGDVILVRFSV